MANHKLNLMVGMNPSQAVGGFKAIGASAATSLADAALGVDKLSARMQALGLTMVAASAVGVKGLYGLAEVGSALSEQQSRVNQIFGDSDSIIKKFGATADKSFGLSERAVNEATATFGTFFKAAGRSQDQAASMSVTMTKLAADMASFADTTPEEAITAIGAAFRGEMEPIRKYGILLDDMTLRQEAVKMGLIRTTSEALNPQAKTLAAYNLILAQSTDMQGNFALTSGGLANQQRELAAQMENLKATIGQSLEPAFSALLKITNHFVGVFNMIPKPLIAVAANAALLGAALTGVAGITTIWISKLLSTSIALKGLDKLTGVLPGKLGKMAKGMDMAAKASAAMRKAVIGAVATDVFVQVYNEIGNIADKQSEAFNNFVTDTSRGSDVVVANFEKMLSAQRKEMNISGLWEDWGRTFKLTADGVAYQIEHVQDVLDKIAETSPESLPSLIASLEEARKSTMTGSQAWEDYTEIIEMAQDRYDGAKVAIDAARIASGELTVAQEDLADAISAAKDALDTHTDAAAALADEYDRILGIWMGLNGQSLDLQQSYLDLNEAIWEYVGVSNGSIETDKSAQQSQIDIQKAIDGTALAYAEHKKTLLEANGVTVTAADEAGFYVEALEDLKDKFPELQGVIDPLIATYENMPKTVTTTVEIDGVDMSAEDVRNYVEDLDGIDEDVKTNILTWLDNGEYDKVVAALEVLDEPIEVQVKVDRALKAVQSVAKAIGGVINSIWGITPKGTPNPSAKAIGGQVYQGEAYRVGEQGPETFIPASNGMIVPAGALNPAQAASFFPNFVPLPSRTSNDSVESGGMSEEDLMANKFEVGDLGVGEYQAYLNKKLSSEEKYSSAWMQTWRTIKGLNDQAARDRAQEEQEAIAQAAAEAQRIQDELDAEARKNEIMFLTGEKSAADYQAFLNTKLGSFQKYSDDWYTVWQKIQSLEAAATEANEQAAEDAKKVQEDTIAAAYDKAAALAALSDANDELAKATKDADTAGGKAYLYSLDKKRTAEERADAAAEADQAFQRLAGAIFDQAEAAASMQYEQGTVEWARAVRSGAENGARGQNSQVTGYLSRLLQSVPQLANGGVIRARPGGTLVNVGEAGRDEAVIPLSRMGGMGGNTYIFMTVNGNNPSEVAKALETYINQTGRKPRGL